MANLSSFYDFVDQHQNHYVQKLAEVVAIDGVSAEPLRRPKVFQMGQWLYQNLKDLGAEVDLVDLGLQKLDNDQTLPLPPLVLAKVGNDPNKRTVCVYGHYDVQPANKSDGWNTDPFILTEDEAGRLFGRGATDDKGPVIAWLWVLHAHRELKIDLPVNLRFIFEGMEECGSEGLDDFIVKEKDGFFKDIDCVCISDNYWLGNNKPCITYGLRGVSYFCVEISGPGRDLHSGLYGGSVHEPMTDLFAIMSRLVDSQGKILIPGIMDSVAPLTEEEKKLYEHIDFNHADFHATMGSSCTIHESEKDTLLHRWRFPSLTLHGIEGAFSGVGAKTVIPAKVIGKFSIRTVPNQEPKEISRLTIDYLNQQFASLKTKNTMRAYGLHAGKSWLSDINHWNYEAAIKAVERIFGVKPDLTREGGSIPVTLTFQEALGKNVLLLPVGAADDGAHSINEKIDRKNYINGIKVMGAYLHEISSIQK